MPWWQNIVPDAIKKNVLAYLLERYLGQFMEEKLTRDQLKVNLWDGTGTVEKISLDIQALNELGEKQNWPMEFVDGYIEKLQLIIPWASILKEPSFVEVKGLKITVQPKQRHESATSMFESMWNSMTSSMQLAEECAKQEAANTDNPAQSYEGLELFAQTIDSILSRVKVKFIDTIIQIEHVPKDSSTGVGLVVNIDLIDYFDEACNDPTKEDAMKLTNQDADKAYFVQSFTTKKFIIQGVTLSTVEFSSKARTFSRSVLLSQSQHDKENDSLSEMFEKCNEQSHISDGPEDCEPPRQKKVEAQPDLSGHRHVIKFGYLSSTQEVTIKMKQSENMNGPKVSIDVNFGSFTLFLSPRQFHLLKELVNGLLSPDIEDTSNVAPRTKCAGKPMSGFDYQRVEQELQHQLQPLSKLNLPGLQGIQGWSTAAIDDSNSEDNFLPMKNTVSSMYDSSLSGVNNSMESSFSSSMGSSVTEHSNRSRKRLNNLDSDPTAEITHFHIAFASVALILLHEDLLVEHVESNRLLVPSSVQQMQQTVEKFFSNLGSFTVTSYGNKDFEDATDIFNKACSLNHLRVLAAPIQIEGDEKTTNSAFSVSGNLMASKLEVNECLFDSPDCAVEIISILKFVDTNPVHMANLGAGKPCVRANFKHVERTAKHATRRNAGPNTDITVILNKLEVDFDITIIDRITALLAAPNLCIVDSSRCNPWTAGAIPPQLPTITAVESKTDLKISSPHLNFKLRFPIPDFRPAHDMNRIPWWQRHVRNDYLSLVFSDIVFQSTFWTNQNFEEYGIRSKGLQIYYLENNDSSPLHIAKCQLDDDFSSSMHDILSQIRISINIFPDKVYDLEETNESNIDPMTTSFYGAFENQTCVQPGPFSAKKVVHKSDTPHSKPQKDDSDELIIPGDKHELDEFIKSTSSCSKIQVEVFVPMVSLQFRSKHIYEVIYNRINNDLLLWTPSAPKAKANSMDTAAQSNYCLGGKNLIVDGQDTFMMCKSGIQYVGGDSDSDSSDESDSGSNIFFSTHESGAKLSAKHQPTIRPTANLDQSQFVLNIQIAQGLLCLNTPVRDAATNVIPGQQGEFLLNLEDANVFIVNGYKGDENLGYVCVQLHDARLFHCDMKSIPSQAVPLRDFGAMVGKHLSPTIYKSEKGMLASTKNRGGSREMFTVAVKIQASHETHHVKTVQVSIGLNNGTLKHRMCHEPNTWISHLMDFFNVQDYSIPNYRAKDVLTELHIHLWDCAIDYRPQYLPVRSAITIGNFSMSSHLSTQANSSMLRFIFEECGLFLSERAPPRNGVVSLAPVDLNRDYVNVVELGLFELSLKTNDKKSGANPHIDLRASNNLLNVHTCADSGRMLMQFLTYLASDGDLSQSPAESPFSSPKHHVDQELIVVEPQDISNLSKSQHEQVNTLLGEAMKESVVVDEPTDGFLSPGAELFYFPGEKQSQQDFAFKPLPQVTSELGDTTFRLNKSSDTDDEFCIIGNEPGLGLFPKSGLPEINWLSSDPVRLVDNHFAPPLGKTDLLKPPKSFPSPVTRYTLFDMSVVWHMYGGNDFKMADGETKKKTVNFSDASQSHAVSFSKAGESRVRIANSADKKKANLAWTIRGGVNRDHDVHMELHLNKIRFQHEVYPETTTQASRQVIVVSDIEIIDRLESSQINKFLYQYSSQARPKQTHAHMVVIKALHIRPDPKLFRQECCLKVSLLPLRFNIDQDALLFLIHFFSELGNGGPAKTDEDEERSSTSKHNTPTHQPPVMTIGEKNEEMRTKEALKVVDENLIMLLEESKNQQDSDNISVTSSSSASDGSPIYFRNVIFSPDVPIKLDYHGKRVDMTHGSLPGLLMGLGQLNCSELRLKRVKYRHGLLGFEKLINFLLQEWLNDIKKNQLPSILGGVGPMHSLVQLFQGLRDLFWLPIEQYQKDGRIIRGLQRGANSFTTSTAMAALELTSRLIHLIQITAETAYDMLSPGPSVRRLAKSKGKRKRYNQPQDIREGMANAISLVKEGIGETADNIVQVASQEKEQKGYSGAVGSVLRQMPPTILKPIIIAAEATGNVLGGMRSQLVPDARQEANQKWRSDNS